MQQIKIALVDMINRGEDPLAIVEQLAAWLEKESKEPGYAKYVSEQIRAVYGFALQHKKPLEDEYKEVELRLKTIESRRDNPDFDEELRQRIDFAIEAHKQRLSELDLMIKEAR